MDSWTVISHCEFAVVSDQLEPAEVTARLGISPNRFHVKGDKSISKHSSSILTKPNNVWSISSPTLKSDEEDLNAHFNFLRNIVEPKIDAILALKNSPKTELVLWIWLETDAGGAGFDMTGSDLSFWGKICDRVHFSIVAIL